MQNIVHLRACVAFAHIRAPHPGSSRRSWRPLSSTASAVSITKSTPVVEHIVLFKVKDGVPPERAQAMVSGLRSLKSLDSVIELSAGPALQTGSYTHALHCRYKDKEALAAYADHPFHLDVVSKYVAPIVEDRLALDWEADLEECRLESSYGAVRVAVLKPKANLAAEEFSSMIDMLKGYRALFPFIKQVSVGKNFSPARAKGFGWGFLAFFPGLQELEELAKNEERVNVHYSKFRSAMEHLSIVDYHTT